MSRVRDLEAAPAFLTDEQERCLLEPTVNHDGRDYTLGNQFGHLAIYTEDLDAVIRTDEERGWWYRGSRPEAASRDIFVKDPDGYDVEILERREN